LVNKKPGLAVIVPTFALTVYPPVVPLAVNTGAVATPEALVVTIAVLDPPANVPLAPLAGAVKVTVAPETAFPNASVTVAARLVAKAVWMAALCGVPAVAVIAAAAPA
jgi:hypothetical protein